MIKKDTQGILYFLAAYFLALVLIGGRFFLYINADSAGLLYEAKRVYFGEVLNRDFFEINPPLIIYLMLIPVWLYDVFKINLPDIFILFIAALTIISLVIAFAKINSNLIKFSLLILAFLPLGDFFGQREYIYVILILPYVVSLWQKESPQLSYQIISGLMAGIGFALKPYFLILWGVLMLVKMIVEKKFFNFLTWQNIIIGLFLVAYLLFLLLVEKNYIQVIVPLLLRHYDIFDDKNSVYKIVLVDFIVYQTMFWVIFLIKRKILNRAIYISNFACLASLLVIAILNRTFVYYQYPVVVFGVLTNILIIKTLCEDLKPPMKKAVLAFSFVIIVQFLATVFEKDFRQQNRRWADNDIGQAIGIYNTYAKGGNVYFLGTAFGKLYFPALLYSEAEMKSYYGTSWLLPAVYSFHRRGKNTVEYHKVGHKPTEEAEFSARIVKDFQDYPPQIVVVENYNQNIWPFSYLKYFMQEPEFAKIWPQYKLLRSFDDQDVYIRN